MGTMLTPRCDSCGELVDPSGFSFSAETLQVWCKTCRASSQAEWDEITCDAIAQSIATFEEEHGRPPGTTLELLEWIDGNVDGSRGPLRLSGEIPDDFGDAD